MTLFMPTMTTERLHRLLDRLSDVRNTDELYDLEIGFGPFDEDDPIAVRALYNIAAIRCSLSRGPAPAPDAFQLTVAPPAHARERFEVRGRMGSRIVRVGWADGQLFGSRHALARLGFAEACVAEAATARARIIERLDVVLDETVSLAVA